MKPKRRNIIGRVFPFLWCAALLLTGLPPAAAVAETGRYTLSGWTDTAQTESYAAYAGRHSGAAFADQTARANIGAPVRAEGAELLQEAGGRSGAALATGDTADITLSVSVEKEGLYELSVTYLPQKGNPTDIARRLELDGRSPFREASYLRLPRLYRDAGPIGQDQSGNDVVPAQEEVFVWQTVRLRDRGSDSVPFRFYLTAGEHTLRLISEAESAVIGEVAFVPPTVTPTWAQVKQAQAAYERAGCAPLIYEAEADACKTSPTISPTYDRSTPATSPSSYRYLRLNTIGADRWKYPGDAVTWTVNVPQSGLYRIALKARQNLSSGVYTTRSLTIDGELPFSGADDLRFAYDDSWRIVTLGSGTEDYWFYLTEGEHEITLEAMLGNMRSLVTQITALVEDNNAIYRQILMITGADPDLYRDYDIQKQLPQLKAQLQTQRERIQSAMAELLAQTGKRGSQYATLQRMDFRLGEMIRNPEEIPSYFSDYKDCITSLGSWLMTAKEQPLELDWLAVYGEDDTLPQEKAGFFASLAYHVMAFVSSYFQTYNTLGNIYDDGTALTVWIGSGRDQSTVLKKLIDDRFVPAYSVGVNLSLVKSTSLLPATLAGQGPDVALQIGQTEIVNFAMRGAVRDLSRMDGYAETIAQFYDSAAEPFAYEGGVYALPETQTFPMLFYRKDILAELGVREINSWEDVYAAIAVLQKKHLNFGLPADTQAGFGLFLYQKGGSFYRDGGRRSGMNTEQGVEAFKQLTEFYANYGSPQEYNFATRFRIGEIPLAVADISMYGLLSVYAPEIQGMWGMLPVPGTVREDGTLDRSVPASAAGAMLFSAAKDPQAAFTFMRWWVSADIQAEYGRGLEDLLGVSARYFTANRAAAAQLAWTREELSALSVQWEEARAIPEVPGGYLTARALGYAFKAVVISRQPPRDALTDHVKSVDRELREKRQEFGLEP